MNRFSETLFYPISERLNCVTDVGCGFNNDFLILKRKINKSAQIQTLDGILERNEYEIFNRSQELMEHGGIQMYPKFCLILT